MCHRNTSCRDNTPSSETKQDRARLCLNCHIYNSVDTPSNYCICICYYCVIISAFFPIASAASDFTKSSLSVSVCVHLQYLCLLIYLSTSIISSPGSPGNRVLHVIAPWENQIGTLPFLWVCFCTVCLIQTFVIFSANMWNARASLISGEFCMGLSRAGKATIKITNMTLLNINLVVAMSFKVNENKCWIHYCQPCMLWDCGTHSDTSVRGRSKLIASLFGSWWGCP